MKRKDFGEPFWAGYAEAKRRKVTQKPLRRRKVFSGPRQKVRQRTWSEFGKQAAGAAAGAVAGHIIADQAIRGGKMAWDRLAPNLIQQGRLMKSKVQANNSYGAGKKYKNKKVSLKKPKKPAKVSKEFKNKVQAALKEQGKSFTASWRQFTYSGFAVNAGTNDAKGPLYPGRQGVFAVGSIANAPTGTYKISTADFTGAVGNVEDWVYMLSVMYNNAAESQGSRQITREKTLGNTADPINQTIIPGGSTIVSAVQNNLVFLVKNCYDVYRFKNNTGRSYTIDAYSCKPKVDYWQESPFSPILPNTSATEEGYFGSPVSAWSNGLYDQNLNQVNAFNANCFDYGMNPTGTPNFKKSWDSELTKIVLEPGESYEWKMQGVSNFKVDMTQRFKNNTFFNLGKYSRVPMFVVKTDMIQYKVGETPQNTCRAGGIGNIAENDILIEREHYAQFEVPEMVGGILVTTAATTGVAHRTMLGNRFRHIVYTPIIPDGVTGVARMDDENPVSFQAST